ncbi:hypothetical protein [Caenispirillum salinarum]|uniref:hypothetical protein n=1 Tax=Caenispirillum salinarum TaxID=859058 RepID=UPI00384D84B5
MTQTNTAPVRDLLATARASRESAAAFRAEVERLKTVSFEGTLAAVVEFRLMARAMTEGRSPGEALREARAAAAARGSASASAAPLPMAAE